MEQSALFVESFEEAIADAVKALRGPKAVGTALWPEMSAELAAKRLNHCLDPERPEKLELSQVLLIAKRAREVNCHTVMAFLAAQLDYEYTPVDPETLEAKETREIAELLKTVNARLARFEKRQADKNQLRRVA